MLLFARQDEPERKGFWERRAERRRRRLEDEETERVREAFKFLIPRAHAAECLNATINILAIEASDLQIDHDVKEAAPELIAEYASIMNEVQKLRVRVIQLDEKNDEMHQVAEIRRLARQRGEDVEEAKTHETA